LLCRNFAYQVSYIFFCIKCLATEIRCQEKSKGGIKYEVILAEPNLTQIQLPKVTQSNQKPTSPVSAQEIQDKLKAAEERRLVIFKILVIKMVTFNALK
jgi:hypothetical protein